MAHVLEPCGSSRAAGAGRLGKLGIIYMLEGSHGVLGEFSKTQSGVEVWVSESEGVRRRGNAEDQSADKR